MYENVYEKAASKTVIDIKCNCTEIMFLFNKIVTL